MKWERETDTQGQGQAKHDSPPSFCIAVLDASDRPRLPSSILQHPPSLSHLFTDLAWAAT